MHFSSTPDWGRRRRKEVPLFWRIHQLEQERLLCICQCMRQIWKVSLDGWNYLGTCIIHPFWPDFCRSKIKLIADDINSKTFDEVERYANVFWERYKELNGKWRRRRPCSGNSSLLCLFLALIRLRKVHWQDRERRKWTGKTKWNSNTTDGKDPPPSNPTAATQNPIHPTDQRQKLHRRRRPIPVGDVGALWLWKRECVRQHPAGHQELTALPLWLVYEVKNLARTLTKMQHFGRLDPKGKLGSGRRKQKGRLTDHHAHTH